MEREHGELLEYQCPHEWEELETDSGAVLSLVALVAMVAVPAAVVVFVVFAVA